MANANYTELDPEHLQAIKEIAEQSDCPVEEVREIYLSALESYRSNARIQDYLILLISRKVRGLLAIKRDGVVRHRGG